MKRNKNIKIIVSCILTAVLTFCILIPAGNLVSEKFSPNRFSDKQTMKEFYTMEKNSIDILAFGSSQVLAGFAAPELYKQFGYSAFGIGSGHMTVMGQYHWLCETLQYQTPKLVIIEAGSLYSHNPEVGFFRCYSAMKDTSPYKWEGVSEHLGDADIDEYLEYYIDIYGFHSRWSELRKSDFEFLVNEERPTYGGSPVRSVSDEDYGIDESFYLFEETDEAVPFRTELAATYIDKIVELCEKEGIELLLYKTVKYDWDANKSANVKKYAEEKGINFIDFNLKDNLRALELDYDVDMFDPDHTTIYGAIKMTTALGDFISENYDIPDRRSDGSAANLQQEEIQIGYQQALHNNALSASSNLKEALTLLDNEHYTFALAKNGKVNLDKEALELIKELGFESDLSGDDCYALFKDENRIVKDVTSGSNYVHKGVLFSKLRNYYLASTEDKLSVRTASTTHIVNGSGNVVISVYDNYTKGQVCNLTFDSNMNVVD